VLCIIKSGYRIEFNGTPFQFRDPTIPFRTDKEITIINELVSRLENIGAVEKCDEKVGQFVS